MLRLNLDQAELLDQLALRRHSATIGSVLAEAWPAMTERLKERWPEFVQAALQQGRQHGIADPRDLARYASLWCIWGPAFDAKPAFAWAAEILADSRRPSTLKVHQLAHRTREELQERQPAGPGAAPSVTLSQFDAALERVDKQVGALAAAKAVFPETVPRVPIKACDVTSVDMMVAEVENLQEYRHGPSGWQRVVVPKLGLAPVHWTRAPEEPAQLAVTSNALRAGPVARLNLKIQAEAVCGAGVHPEVVHVSAQGRLAWKGRDTARLSLALYALPVAAAAPAVPPPGIAAEAAPDFQTVHLASCGLRDAGAPFGDLDLALRVYPATQWLVEVRHPAWPAMQWPVTDQTAEGAPLATCRLQADGAPRDAAAWQLRWIGLHTAFREGMERLFNAWTRALDGRATRLEVEASPLVGQAGITWGWRRTGAAEVAMRTHGVLDFIACSLDLRLSGEISHGSARSRIRVACKGRSELRMTLAQLGAEGPEGQDLKSAARVWRFPFTIEVEPLASPDLVSLYAASAAEAALGAVEGVCGLRPRPDGAGLQWFFVLRTQPLSVALQSADPIVGSGRHARALLPALTLVDWSAG